MLSVRSVLIYTAKTGELLMDETRSSINGSHIQDKEPYGLDATEQMSLNPSKNTLGVLVGSLCFL